MAKGMPRRARPGWSAVAGALLLQLNNRKLIPVRYCDPRDVVYVHTLYFTVTIIRQVINRDVRNALMKGSQGSRHPLFSEWQAELPAGTCLSICYRALAGNSYIKKICRTM